MKCSIKTINRVKRAHGQMAGVIKMMESSNTCMDIVTQLKAIRSSIDRTIAILATDNLSNKLEEKYQINLDEFEKEIDLIVKGV